jgi:hypothetical protein
MVDFRYLEVAEELIAQEKSELMFRYFLQDELYKQSSPIGAKLQSGCNKIMVRRHFLKSGARQVLASFLSYLHVSDQKWHPTSFSLSIYPPRIPKDYYRATPKLPRLIGSGSQGRAHSLPSTPRTSMPSACRCWTIQLSWHLRDCLA